MANSNDPGFTAAGITACCGVSVPALIEAIKFHPLILYSGKFLLTYAFGYHYVCGLRHIVLVCARLLI